ncbi:winged helix-turn-helix domain-containing protein [Cryobacterium sp. PAMC25264]|uniref:winged helix-turn-helix domain-containing protein n=1 Tax=Cryobacterium sp. PAMC25264 TaxID=2861288 RepID=UPI001C62F55A|nr:winged helix-turn-helix domain-containing protein [Cryobacterium sp. PAMC25264]QYF74170.1 winged helix-turn-helix domain-containing protein [Cryobacterium sp. PAMC25264]
MDWAGGSAGADHDGDEVRGFGFFVRLDGDAAPREALAAALTDVVARLAPDAQVHVEQEPGTGPGAASGGAAAHKGVRIDVGRQLLLVDGLPVQLSYREFRFLCYLVLRPGVTVGRAELIDAQRTWSRVTSPRTIDVHIQRLRVKLGGYGDILRTDRGTGYRYDAHADVRIRR